MLDAPVIRANMVSPWKLHYIDAIGFRNTEEGGTDETEKDEMLRTGGLW